MTQTEINELIQGYFDDVLSDTESQQLADWIKADPANAKAFARESMLHDRLQSEMVAASDVHQTVVDSGSETTHTTFASRRAVVAALAACLIAAVGTSIWMNRSDSPSRSFAAIAQAVEVQGGTGIDVGSRLGRQRIKFDSGFVRLQFDNGVEVTLEGPADYELLALGETRLNAGLLSATVPPGAEGFRVDTPSARVTDLGTAFGIRLDESGAAEVSVFDGEVDVAANDSDEQRLLKEGEAIRVASSESTSKKIALMDFDTQPYEKLWPISSGIAGSTGDFEFAPPWPRRLRFVKSDDKIFVLPEGYRTAIPESLDVNISEPGNYRRADRLTPSTISSGQNVRSFLLHYRPENAEFGTRIQGSITFDRPVLGLIVLQRELAASRKLFAPRGVSEFRAERQLELTGNPAGDKIELSEDKRTVRVNLAVPRRFSDLVRVILDAS